LSGFLWQRTFPNKGANDDEAGFVGAARPPEHDPDQAGALRKRGHRYARVPRFHEQQQSAVPRHGAHRLGLLPDREQRGVRRVGLLRLFRGEVPARRDSRGRGVGHDQAARDDYRALRHPDGGRGHGLQEGRLQTLSYRGLVGPSSHMS
jgi:hypothetical protein